MKRRWFLAIISVFVVVFLVLVWQNEQIKTICDSNRIYCQTDSDCMCTSCGVDSKICNYFHDMGFLCEYNICMNEIEDSTSTVRCSENKCILVEFNDLNPTISYDWMKYNCRVDSDCSMAGAEEMGPNYGPLDCECILNDFLSRFDECQFFGNQTSTHCVCINHKCEKNISNS